MCKMISRLANWARVGAMAAAVMTAAAFSQNLEEAKIPVRVNMAADVSIQPENGVVGQGAQRTLQANRTDTIVIRIASDMTSVAQGAKRHGAPAAIVHNRGNVQLTLSPQTFDKADISLFSVSGKRVMRGKAAHSGVKGNLSRANITAGVYLLSVRGKGGGSFAAKLHHSGGKMSIDVSFLGEGQTLYKGQESADASAVGSWTITATATQGNASATQTFTPVAGVNPLQTLTLTTGGGNTNDSTVTIAYSSSGSPTINNPMSSRGVNITTSGQNVTVKANTTTQVNYVLSGSTTNGSFKLYTDTRAKLTLDGVTLTNTSGPAINIQTGKRTDVDLPSGKTSKLTDGSSYQSPITVDGQSESQKAAFFSEGQLVFDGAGTLEVESKARHGICSDDWVRILNGNIKIKAKVDGIHVNDAFEMSGGTLDITAESDGVDVEKDGGAVEITGGTLKMAISGQGSKGIKSPGTIVLSGGNFDFNITANAYYNTEDRDNKSPAGFKSDGNFTISGNPTIKVRATGSGGKGINTGGTLTIRGGNIDIGTTGGQFRGQGSVSNGYVRGTGCTGSGSGGWMTISADSYCPGSGAPTSSAKAIKSQGDMTINDGVFKISTTGAGAEGLESKAKLTINGGDIQITANDDAINSRKDLTISGGKIYAYSSTNDGIDVNGLCYCGNIFIKGGTIIAVGVNNSMEEGIDGDIEYSNTRFEITGGTLIAIGGKTDEMRGNTTQSTLIWKSSGNFTANQMVSVRPSNGGTDIMTFKVPRQYSSSGIVLSSPDLRSGTGYTIYKGGNAPSGVSEYNGLYIGGTSNGGTQATTFTATNGVTTVETSGGRSF